MRRRIAKYFTIFAVYFAQFAKVRLSYRADFLMGMTADLLAQFMSLVFLLVVFTKIPQLKGWSLSELVFIYGFFMIPYGLFNIFFAGLWSIGGQYIIEGQLDRVLLRPINGFFQILVESVDPESFNGVITGTVIVVYASRRLQLPWTPLDILLLLILVLGATLVYGGVFLTLACINFWFEDRVGLLPPVYNMIDFGKYPTPIYGRAIKVVLTWLIPFAFVGFYPSALFLRGGEYKIYGLFTPLVGAAFMGLGYSLWRRGLRQYQSTGS
ncbi:MAG: ABC transporter permease [bacterium]